MAARMTWKTRKATKANPWHYTGCGLDNVYLVGIEVRVDPSTGDEDPVIPRMRDLHDCIFLGVLLKRAPLTGREVRFLRRHLRWTQEEAAKSIMASSAQHFSKWERKGNGKAFDIWRDFAWRMLCAKTFQTKFGRRGAEAAKIVQTLEEVGSTLAALKADSGSCMIEIRQQDSEWKPPTELLAA